jgi:hypothetical protein
MTPAPTMSKSADEVLQDLKSGDINISTLRGDSFREPIDLKNTEIVVDEPPKGGLPRGLELVIKFINIYVVYLYESVCKSICI